MKGVFVRSGIFTKAKNLVREHKVFDKFLLTFKYKTHDRSFELNFGFVDCPFSERLKSTLKNHLREQVVFLLQI